MSKANYEFEELIRRVGIDNKPDPAHRAKLRWQMLSTFNKTRRLQASRQTTRRIIMKSPFAKLAVAAAVIIAVIVGIRQFTSVGASDQLPDSPNPTATPQHQAGPEMEAIDIELPNAMFRDTPINRRVPNLEKPLGRPRPSFLAPVGTKNVALGKPVFSTDDEPILGEIEMITDGDKEATDGSYVELGPFAQHVTIDLEAVHNIYAVVVWHYHRQPVVYYDVAVQVGDDRDFIENVRIIFNNDIDNSIGLGVGEDMHYTETNEGKLIDAKGVKARYVRLHSRGGTDSDLNHYIEVEVYGKPVGDANELVPLDIELPKRLFM